MYYNLPKKVEESQVNNRHAKISEKHPHPVGHKQTRPLLSGSNMAISQCQYKRSLSKQKQLRSRQNRRRIKQCCLGISTMILILTITADTESVKSAKK